MNVPLELGYICVLCATLICWDIMDFSIEIKRLDFLLTRSFLLYYTIRVFFSICIMEIIFVLDLLNIPNNFVIAFVTPLIFPLILQNLIIGVGGNGVDTQDTLSSFRITILEETESRCIRKSLENQTELLNSSLTIDDLRRHCQLLIIPTDFDALEKRLHQKDEDYAKVVYIKVLDEFGGIKDVKRLIKDKKNSLKRRRNENA